jgi:hypothetical protein
LFAADEARQQQMVEDSVGRGLARDVLPLKPTLVTVKFGMNDHSYQPFREDIFRAYVLSQVQIAKVLEQNGARVAFLTPQPIEEKRPDPDKDPRNLSLRKFSDGLKQVSEKTGAAFVDQFAPYMAIMMRERAGDPAAFIGGGDAVHPGPAGHTIMAWAVLKGLGAPALVSRVQLGSGGKQVTATEGCRVQNLKVADGVISFDRLDEALPMPIDERAQPALKLAPILQELSRYELQVSGLAAGKYELTVDGEPASRFDSEDLAKGCNLSDTAGPVTAQARKVLDLVFKKNNLYFHRWRDVQLYKFPDWAQSASAESQRSAELARLDKEIADAETELNAARKPKSHHFELKRVAD